MKLAVAAFSLHLRNRFELLKEAVASYFPWLAAGLMRFFLLHGDLHARHAPSCMHASARRAALEPEPDRVAVCELARVPILPLILCSRSCVTIGRIGSRRVLTVKVNQLRMLFVSREHR